MSEAAARKDIQKLQRAIVDGLEHVKAHDIRVFDTTHLSPLFERVIVASGTSNRQTKALAASVRDKVREAGLAKPRLEGEENGEWIVVDCGAAVAHVMQPAIRQYYRLEEIWGDKPVRLKFGAPKPVVSPAVKTTAANKVTTKTVVKKTPITKTVASKTAATSTVKNRGNSQAPTRGRATTVQKTVAKVPVKKTAARKTAARKSA
jgi:ribosome-associated protein